MKRSFVVRRTLFTINCVVFGLGLIETAASQSEVSPRASSKKSDRAYTIAKDTTFFTGPLKADGAIDFIGAVNAYYAKGVTPENNAARIIVPLVSHAEFGTIDHSRRDRVLESLGLDPTAHPIDKAFQDVGPYFNRDVAKIQEFEKQYSVAQSRSWTAVEFPKVARWLADNESALNQIARGATKDKYFVPWAVEGDSDALHSILLDHVQANRSIARALQARVNLQLGEQNWEGAWADVLTIRRLGRLLGQGPSLVEGLVGLAITGMACESAKRFIVAADAQAVDWSALQESWNVAPIARISESLGVCERAMLIQMICRFADYPDQAASEFPIANTDFGEFASILSNKAFARTLHEMVHSGEVPLDEALRYVNHMYDRAIAISQITDARERMGALMQMNDEVVHSAEGEPSLMQVLFSKAEAPATQFAKAMMNSIFPALEAVHAAEWRTEGSLHVIELALAARGVHARTGDWPASLRELEPWVDRAVMEQPLSGDPIALRIEDGDLLIYHWAHNRKDDGGDFDQTPYRGGGRNSNNPQDWGIRLR